MYHTLAHLQTMSDAIRTPLGPPLAYVTGDLPGCGGRLRTALEDFQVEELPAYAPSGSGEHLYLWVEKRGLSTAAVLEALRRRLELPPEAAGSAGKKDAQALARQWVSLHTPADPSTLGDWPPASAEGTGHGFRVLAASRHGNKLRPGHLRGNRFAVTLRGLADPDAAGPVLQRLERDGFPNYLGPQRMGPRLANALAGRSLLRAGGAPRGTVDRHRFAVNAYQGALFNLLVEQRLRTLGDLERLLSGDLALLHRNGAAFAVTAAGLAEAQTRAEAHELSPSAPLFGHRTTLATGHPGAWERALLAREGLTLASFRLGGKRLSPKGERRAVRAFPQALAWEVCPAPDGLALRLTFTLPPGTYATSLLRELTRNDDLASLPAPAAPPSAAAGGP